MLGNQNVLEQSLFNEFLMFVSSLHNLLIETVNLYTLCRLGGLILHVEFLLFCAKDKSLKRSNK